MLNIVQLPVLKDNYIYILHDPVSLETAVVDPAVADPVLEILEQRQWSLKYIFNTHQHWDHIGGNVEIKEATGCKVIASEHDKDRIPGIDIVVRERFNCQLGEQQISVIDTPGHTLGHIAYYAPQSDALFCGDTLFGMGCGRLFEGTAQQLWQSLQKFKSLPKQTQVYCAHEYTFNNGLFALTLEPDNADLKARVANVKTLRESNLSTVPFNIDVELKTNPFLRVDNLKLQKRLGFQGESEAAVFAKIRQLKDIF